MGSVQCSSVTALLGFPFSLASCTKDFGGPWGGIETPVYDIWICKRVSGESGTFFKKGENPRPQKRVQMGKASCGSKKHTNILLLSIRAFQQACNLSEEHRDPLALTPLHA